MYRKILSVLSVPLCQNCTTDLWQCWLVSGWEHLCRRGCSLAGGRRMRDEKQREEDLGGKAEEQGRKDKERDEEEVTEGWWWCQLHCIHAYVSYLRRALSVLLCWLSQVKQCFSSRLSWSSSFSLISNTANTCLPIIYVKWCNNKDSSEHNPLTQCPVWNLSF